PGYRSSQAAHGPVLELRPVVDAEARPLAADAGLLDAAEGRDLGRDESRVDAEDPVLQGLADAPGSCQVAGHVVRGEAVRRPPRDRARPVLALYTAACRH